MPPDRFPSGDFDRDWKYLTWKYPPSDWAPPDNPGAPFGFSLSSEAVPKLKFWNSNL
jgi:hypothetical protein